MGYFGSKATAGLCQLIIAMMPPHDTYIETHLGGGAIMKRKSPALHNIGIDLDPKALSEFECDYPLEKIHGCAHEFLTKYDYKGRELVYSDPPYLKSTRSPKNRYRFEYEEEDHIKLLGILGSLPCKVMISGHPSTLYDNLLKGWRCWELQVVTQGVARTEKLWFNFTPDKQHWISCTGKNFTDRQRIKRKAQRWEQNYRTMPKNERLAVLAGIMAVEAEDIRKHGQKA
jgi:DNA adenine methylase